MNIVYFKSSNLESIVYSHGNCSKWKRIERRCEYAKLQLSFFLSISNIDDALFVSTWVCYTTLSQSTKYSKIY